MPCCPPSRPNEPNQAAGEASGPAHIPKHRHEGSETHCQRHQQPGVPQTPLVVLRRGATAGAWAATLSKTRFGSVL
jgi:hypothetical protein